MPSVSLLPVQNDRCGLQLWSTLFLEKPCSKKRPLSVFYHCPTQLHCTCRGPGGWWWIDNFHPLETKRFGTCKLCISCLQKAYVITFENCHSSWINSNLRYATKTQLLWYSNTLKKSPLFLLGRHFTVRELEQLLFLLLPFLFSLKISIFLSINFLYVALFVIVTFFVFICDFSYHYSNTKICSRCSFFCYS